MTAKRATQEFTPRLQFNWGFHDAQQAAERGWEPEWTPGKHPSRDYEAGYWSGRAEFEANGERLSESSDKAWAEHQAIPGHEADDHPGTPAQIRAAAFNRNRH